MGRNEGSDLGDGALNAVAEDVAAAATADALHPGYLLWPLGLVPDLDLDFEAVFALDRPVVLDKGASKAR